MTRIVVGYDGSEQSHDALVLGVLLAEWIDANVILQRPSRICSRESTTRAPRRLSLPSRTPSPGPSRHREQRGRGSRRRGLDPPAPWAACFRAGGGVGPPDRYPPERGRCTKVLVSGSPAEILVSKGRRAVDLMVTGTRGYGRLLRFLLGSVSSDVVRRAPWPVIVVPPTARIELAQRDGEGAHRQQLVSHWSKL
jgi:nucleotide-binding universal stress UspA family protein